MSIVSPALNPSRQGREVLLLPLDGGGREGVNYLDKYNCILRINVSIIKKDL